MQIVRCMAQSIMLHNRVCSRFFYVGSFHVDQIWNMTISETWLLPDGVADGNRRKSLKNFAVKLSISSRLSTGIYTIYRIHRIVVLELNQDLDLVTFKVIDQLFYLASVLTWHRKLHVLMHTRWRCCTLLLCRDCITYKNFNATRAPLQLGAELYGLSKLTSKWSMLCSG